jgi:threonine/homoserine/homoserine lactone efflux protein
MFGYMVLGATYAFAAAVQPGPFQTYMIAETLAKGWRRTLPVALAPVLSDGPVILLVLLVLTRVPAGFQGVLRLAGGMFILYLAAKAFRVWRSQGEFGPGTGAAAPSGVWSAAFVNLLNPNPYLAWSLVMGPVLITAWHETPARGIAFLASFYSTLVLTLAVFIVLFGQARDLGPRVTRALIGVSVVALAALACYQLWSGARILLA